MRLIRTASTACGFAADQAGVSFSLRYLRSMQIHLTEFHGQDWTEVLHRTRRGLLDALRILPTLTQVGVVVGLVGMEFGRFATAWSPSGSDRGDGSNQRFERVGVVGVRGGHRHRQWQARPVDRTWIFEPDLPRSTGLGPVRVPLFGPNRRTIQDRPGPVDQALAAKFVQHRVMQPPPQPSPRPLSEPAMCRRHRVTPNDGGNNRQGQPLVSTYTTAVNTARSSTGARPPPCGRGENDGINGSASAHNSSGTNRRDNASTTTHDHAQSNTRSIRDISFPTCMESPVGWLDDHWS